MECTTSSTTAEYHRVVPGTQLLRTKGSSKSSTSTGTTGTVFVLHYWYLVLSSTQVPGREAIKSCTVLYSTFPMRGIAARGRKLLVNR